MTEKNEDIKPKNEPHEMHSMNHSEHMMDHSALTKHTMHENTEIQTPGVQIDHSGHQSHSEHADHSGHERMFKSRFWISLALSIPVIVFSPMIQK